MINYDFNNRLILITGASSGIGKEIALLLANSNARVVAVARDAEKMEILKAESKFPDMIINIQYDIAKDTEANANFITDLCKEMNEPLSGMVLCAGKQETRPLATMKREKSLAIFDVNYFANIALIKGFAKRGNYNPEGSSVVAISSIMAHKISAGLADYSASKAALVAAMKTFAIELAKNKIRVNTISPGHIITPMLEQSGLLKSKYYSDLEQRYPLGFGKTQDVASLTAYLLSEQAAWITGADYIIDGGISSVL